MRIARSVAKTPLETTIAATHDLFYAMASSPLADAVFRSIFLLRACAIASLLICVYCSVVVAASMRSPRPIVIGSTRASRVAQTTIVCTILFA